MRVVKTKYKGVVTEIEVVEPPLTPGNGRMLWIRDTSAVPPAGGWRYPHVAAGEFVHATNYHALFDAVEKAYRSNDQPVPSHEQIIRWLCENLFVPCQEGNQPLINSFTSGILPRPAQGCCGGKK